MKRFTVTLLICLANRFLGSSFSIRPILTTPQSAKERASSASSLFGTVRFVGNADARLDTPSIITTDQDEDRSLSNFMASSASDPVLLGSQKTAEGAAVSQRMRMDDDSSGSGELWESRQASIEWFGLQLTPIFISRIEKNPASGNVVTSIIDAQTEVQQGGRLGNTLSSVMKRSAFEGRNVVSWKEIGVDDSSADAARKYTLEGNLKLTVTINLPPFLPLPPGFNAIGSKIVERTCHDRLGQILRDISDAYLIWATTPQY